MSNSRAMLREIARRAMIERGFEAEYSPAAAEQARQLSGDGYPTADRRDLRHLPWCSIDNEDSRDLDQLSVAEVRGNDTAILVAIADVDAMVPCDSPIDRHASTNTTSVYTPAIVALAAETGTQLPAMPDGRALEQWLLTQRRADPDRFADVSLSVVKLLGRGEYVVELPNEPTPDHFGLAADDYSHSTAPNRRFADLVTQRQLKAALAGKKSPYSHDALSAIAARCMEREDAANRVERQVRKAAAAMVLDRRIGEAFDAVVTGASPKGTWVRLRHPVVEGKLELHGSRAVQVGDRVRVRLTRVDPPRGFIDFALESNADS